MNKVCQIGSELIILVGMVALLVTGFSTVASADTEVNANVVVVVSDDITKKTTNVARAGDGGGNNNNLSGLGDGTNPSQGSGTDKSTNEGSDNPNNVAGGGGKKK